MATCSAAHPEVSILVPCLDEERTIERVIRQALGQAYPRERLEVLVADGGSRDATRSILARLRREDPRLRLFANPKRHQAPALNAMIRRARGDVLIRMDAHCEYPPNYVACCVEALSRSAADNVGGAQRLRARTRFQHALADALRSPLAMGAAAYRDPGRSGWVDTVFLGAFPRATFERFGLYDPGAVTNEDAELNQRIVAGGGRVWLCSDIVVHYQPRARWAALFRQYRRYGTGRARTWLKHGRFLTARPLAPFLALLVGALLSATAPAVAALGLAVYVLVTVVEAWRVGSGRGVAHALAVWALFPTLHLAHGLGFLLGLVRYRLAPDWTALEPLEPRSAARSAGVAEAAS